MNLLAMTPCCVDFYPQINSSFLGGNSLNVASMWKKLSQDSHVSVITCLGNDENGKRIFDFLKNNQIDVSHVRIENGKTACNQLRVDETGERFGIEGTWEGGVYETFLLSEDDWNYVERFDIIAIPANNPNFNGMIKRKHQHQMLVVDYLDVENNIDIEQSIENVDIAFVTARKSMLLELEYLANATKTLLVVTLGSHGSQAFFYEKIYFQPAINVPKIVDTTGCGDAYQAAFSLNYKCHNDIALSMKAGAMAASSILQYWGGVGNKE